MRSAEGPYPGLWVFAALEGLTGPLQGCLQNALGTRFPYPRPLPSRAAWLQPSPGPLLPSASGSLQPWPRLCSLNPCVPNPPGQHLASGEQCPPGPGPELFQA